MLVRIVAAPGAEVSARTSHPDHHVVSQARIVNNPAGTWPPPTMCRSRGPRGHTHGWLPGPPGSSSRHRPECLMARARAVRNAQTEHRRPRGSISVVVCAGRIATACTIVLVIDFARTGSAPHAGRSHGGGLRHRPSGHGSWHHRFRAGL